MPPSASEFSASQGAAFHLGIRAIDWLFHTDNKEVLLQTAIAASSEHLEFCVANTGMRLQLSPIEAFLQARATIARNARLADRPLYISKSSVVGGEGICTINDHVSARGAFDAEILIGVTHRFELRDGQVVVWTMEYENNDHYGEHFDAPVQRFVDHVIKSCNLTEVESLFVDEPYAHLSRGEHRRLVCGDSEYVSIEYRHDKGFEAVREVLRQALEDIDDDPVVLHATSRTSFLIKRSDEDYSWLYSPRRELSFEVFRGKIFEVRLGVGYFAPGYFQEPPPLTEFERLERLRVTNGSGGSPF